ncbi:MAG: hypothetical protein JSU82_14210 [Rhodospirillales bacterium]|nr:MAG: hypothetical protein JSU82_14210 [Rhodospirillales bacterium]
MAEVHRMFFPYSECPLSMRTRYTGTLLVLGIGYLFARIHIYNSHAGRDGEPGLSVEDIRIAYSGSKEATKLEAAMMGPMSGMLPTNERGDIVGWIRRGLDEREYEDRIKPIFDRRCTACHDGSNPHIPDLNGYHEVSESAEIDTGMDIFTLVRVSHIHLFGLTFIFFIMGMIFSHAYLRPVWFKSLVIIVPFAAITIDIASWYLTKLHPAFALVVIGSGGLMGMSFAIQWVVSMYQIWFYKYQGVKRSSADVL